MGVLVAIPFAVESMTPKTPTWGLPQWKDFFSILGGIATVLGVIIALITLAKALHEYTRQLEEKRAEQFINLRTAYKNLPHFQEIIKYLYKIDGYRSLPPTIARMEFMAFFEDIAFLMKSGLIRKEVAFYMFGGDVIKAWENSAFWGNEFKENYHWFLVNEFKEEMEEMEEIEEMKKMEEIKPDLSKIRL
jgi:hypothetical protein